MKRKQWTAQTRREVLLRCFFVCTRPGCNNIAEDLHHAELHSKGGSNDPKNVLGFCKQHHRWVHQSPGNEELARRWLAEQIDNCPVRLFDNERNKLYEEVLAATCSPMAMRYHTSAVYNASAWNTYEVFLKATWQHLKATGKEGGKVACVVLYQFVNLYRRRQSLHHLRAARRHLSRLRDTFASLDDQRDVEWLTPLIRYHEGYLSFLADASGEEAFELFKASASLENSSSRRIGAAISEAQALVVCMRRGEVTFNRLTALQEALADANDQDGVRWRDENILVHMAAAALAENRADVAYDLVARFVAPSALHRDGAGARPAKALYIAGLALLREDTLAGLNRLEEARRAYWTAAAAEGRAAVLLSLGDALVLNGDLASARNAYTAAKNQPRHMDNDEAAKKAESRLALLNAGSQPRIARVYDPWSPSRDY